MRRRKQFLFARRYDLHFSLMRAVLGKRVRYPVGFREFFGAKIMRQHYLHVNTRKAIRRDTIERERQFAACAC